MTCRLEILSELLESGIAIHLDGDDLVLKPSGQLTDHLAERVRAAKPELVRILAGPSGTCDHCGGHVVGDHTRDDYLNRFCIGCGRWHMCSNKE